MLGLDVDDRLALGLVLCRENVEHGIVDDLRWRFGGLFCEQLNSGLGDGDGYGVDLHGTSVPRLSPACLRFVNEWG